MLGEPVAPGVLDGVDLLIHGAYDLTLTEPAAIEAVNVRGTRLLFTAAQAAGVQQQVLISSMSAYAGTKQIYGSAKLRCEDITREVGGTSVRLGLVYGPGWGGMAGTLRKLVQAPVVPLLGRQSHQFTVHQDDVVAGMVAMAQAFDAPPPVVGLANPTPVPVPDLLREFGRQAGVTPRFVPVPWQPAYGAMRVAERLHVPLPARADSILGLVRPAPAVPAADYWPSIGVTLRPFGS